MTNLPPVCHVLRIPFDFLDGKGYVPKLFMEVGHHELSVIVFKATSKLERYGEKPHLESGILFVPGSDKQPFVVDTVIDPSNGFAIPHRDIEYEQNQGNIQIWPCVEMKEKLCAAINSNRTLNNLRKQRYSFWLGC